MPPPITVLVLVLATIVQSLRLDRGVYGQDFLELERGKHNLGIATTTAVAVVIRKGAIELSLRATVYRLTAIVGDAQGHISSPMAISALPDYHV